MKTLKHPLAALVLSISSLVSTFAMAQDAQTYNRVDFHTEVTQVVANDQLNAVLSIELTDKNPSNLSRELTNTLNAAFAKAKAYSSVKTTTGNQQTYPVYGDNNKLQSWRGRAELRIESQDFKAASELISQLQDKLQLNNLSFSVADNTRKALESRLNKEAIAAFKVKAEEIKSAWGAQSYKLVNLNLGSVGGNNPRPVMMMAKAERMMDSAPAQDFAGGETQLGVSVGGAIELQP